MILKEHESIFRFGIEIELLLESPRKKHGTWEFLAKDLSQRLMAAGIRNHIHDSNTYTEWSIVREVTVQDPEGKNPYQYGIELVSPVHTASSLPILMTHLTKIFSVLSTVAISIRTPRCSSHVHISRQPALSPHELAALAKATLYFERALDALMPPERGPNASHWAQSNRHANNPALTGLTLAECLAKVDAVSFADTASLVETMNLVSRESRYGMVCRKKAHFVRGKTYKWDFTGLLSSSPSLSRHDGGRAEDRGIEGTVEFRQPPGSRTAAEAAGWAMLGVAFVAGAIEIGAGLGVLGGGVVYEEGGSKEELWQLLEKGREALGWPDLQVLDGLFWGSKKE
ncbi:hypothetical protein P885DRAFT_70515 [Corynascus similis CBS 632.67]